ncbi:Uncharacterized protein dnm_085040 [Desulfonema magnum]|uniref:Uncharacterized protein n=1 Tax=Desulfonema magnum TaxID=45655 RepID=A0A975BWC7_9BACT|nr:Uncharacterized protein dnm_085040 [Desulfonema magnum]
MIVRLQVSDSGIIFAGRDLKPRPAMSGNAAMSKSCPAKGKRACLNSPVGTAYL